MKIVLTLLLFISSLFCMQTLQPTYSLQASGDVQDMVYHKPFLYTATSSGSVDIVNVSTKETIETLHIPAIKDFIGDEVKAKLYSIDYFNDKLLLVSQGEKGYRNLWIYENQQLSKIIDISQHLYIKKARFINDNQVVIALLSNELGIVDLETTKITKLQQISPSSFSDFVLSEDKQTIFTTDESGVVREIEIPTLNKKREFKALNLDKVFQIDFKNNTLLTAGQDRKSVLYKKSQTYEFDFDFLLYSCGLNADASLAAIAYNENNDVLIINTQTQTKLFNLTENKAVITKILFSEKKELFVASESKKINFWRLP